MNRLLGWLQKKGWLKIHCNNSWLTICLNIKNLIFGAISMEDIDRMAGPICAAHPKATFEDFIDAGEKCPQCSLPLIKT